MASTTNRTEHDLLGPLQLPSDALYGINTARAAENFAHGGRLRLGTLSTLVTAFGWIKAAAAKTNAKFSVLSPELALVIESASLELAKGSHSGHLIIPLPEGSGGTSLNMNVNEVIANRASQILFAGVGCDVQVHPNDHVNASQSTNDVVPSAVAIGTYLALSPVLNAIGQLTKAFRQQAYAHHDDIRLGRTCLQDAQPMTWGQSFGAHASALERGKESLMRCQADLRTLPLGGTAIGTGYGAPRGFRQAVLAELGGISGIDVTAPADAFDAMQYLDSLARTSAELRTLANLLWKMANDFILLSSGPNGGIAELRLPAVQAGSSIMPGKINPVMPMLLQQCAFEVAGHDAAVALATQQGLLEINHNEGFVGSHLIEAASLLAGCIDCFTDRCVLGLEVDTVRSSDHLQKSAALATTLVPHLGYSMVSQLVCQAEAEGVSFLELVRSQSLLEEAELESVLAQSVAP